MMRRFLAFVAMLGLGSCLVAQDSVPAKVLIPQMGISIKPGEPLSPRAIVQQPTPIKGILSWSIESRLHSGGVRTMAVSPDGQLVATAGNDANVRVWDTTTGKLVHCLVGHDYYVLDVAWSPDGQTLASAGSFDNTVRLWDRKTGNPLRILKASTYTTTLAWAPDGQSLICGGGTSGTVTGWDLPSGREKFVSDQGTRILSLMYTRDGTQLLVAVASTGVVSLDLSTGKPIPEEAAEVPTILALERGIGEKEAWIGSATTVQRYRDGKLDTVKVTMPGYAIAQAPKGELFIKAANNSWTQHSGDDFKATKAIPLVATELRFPSGEPLGFGLALTKVVPFRVGETKPEAGFAIATGTVRPMWQPGRPLVLGLGDAKPSLWDVNTGKSLGTLPEHVGGVTAIAFSADGKQIATGGIDKMVRISDATSGKILRELKGHSTPITQVAFAGDGRLAAAGTDTDPVRIWSPKSDMSQVTLSGHQKTIAALAWSRDNALIATGDINYDLRMYNSSTGKPTHGISISKPIRSLAFSPSGKFLAAGAEDNVIRIVQPTTGKTLQEFTLPIGSPPTVTGLAWTTDSNSIFLGRGNFTAMSLSMRTGKTSPALRTLGPAHLTALTTDGRTMIQGTPDGVIRLFDAATGIPRVTLLTTAETLAAVQANGYYRADPTGEAELVAVSWTKTGMQTQSLAEFAETTKRKNQPGMVRILGR
ncbi:WD40 domain-containing protein [Tuwongella immobilis]|uniref:Anaphase-promoting complex subunit 4-like WD40 domain-containing protein n=1 Tax=Tuwongella immobilis TaxID=692036 RepID=A0A6C2YIX4_9BACT|nr:WD40 repeat domain-containing protein [Tuwongella immobilis]VIP01314.1 wd40 repeat-containing protein : WD-40 repeat protein OS=Accumulibacter phosphatis (strain UW-1) GN=CAP2UW1_2609 PE=4 SV=1: WD40: WD40: Gmad1 [Tuwongella immobilis]VTR98054.1 wd40 repeat-containing protein : WD-40 repeat protein OS=Accumulibacter phosphatis (strain UW-1) GN=CAP2UW1_2609 PE=4 SV=1: WD40: WD40: Gmad1 [Tuwongella immobilis]